MPIDHATISKHSKQSDQIKLDIHSIDIILSIKQAKLDDRDLHKVLESVKARVMFVSRRTFQILKILAEYETFNKST